MKQTTIMPFLLMLLLATAQAVAAEGDARLLCAANATHDCGEVGPCAQGSAESIGIPGFFRIDFKNKLVTARLDDGSENTSRIENTYVTDDRIALQGAENGLAWSMAIMRQDGDMVIAAVGDGVGYVIHGSCIVP